MNKGVHPKNRINPGCHLSNLSTNLSDAKENVPIKYHQCQVSQSLPLPGQLPRYVFVKLCDEREDYVVEPIKSRDVVSRIIPVAAFLQCALISHQNYFMMSLSADVATFLVMLLFTYEFLHNLRFYKPEVPLAQFLHFVLK